MSDSELARKYIHELKLVPHPEGGWFKLVHISDHKISSLYAKKGDRDAVKALCSVIYYLLAPEKLQLDDDDDKPPKFPAHHRNDAGYFHTNNSTTVHTWHSGKAAYTLIKLQDEATTGEGSGSSSKSKQAPEVKRVVVGDDIEAGETMVLVVPPGWWKRSETLSPSQHALISETVTPGWTPEDHAFMSPQDLQSLFCDQQDMIDDFAPNVLPEGHQLDFAA